MDLKADMDTKIKDFANYLLDIGLLIGSSYNDFIKKYKEINEKEKIILEDEEEPDNNFDMIYFKDNISKTLIKFYDSMSEERKKLIAYNIFNKYNNKNNKENNDNFQIDKKELILDLNDINESSSEYSKNKKESSIYKEEHFEIIILSSKKNNKKNNNKDINSFNNFIEKKNKKNKIQSQKNKKTIPDKDNTNLNENCTFQPNINKKNKKEKKDKNKNDINIFDKLYKISKDKKEKEKKEKEENDKKNKIKKSQSSKIRKNFEDRLKFFEDKKKKEEKEREESNKKEFFEKCPFIPNQNLKINNSFNKSFSRKRNTSDNIYKRLYEENEKIKLKYENNLKKMLDDIKDRSNHPIVNHNNIRYMTGRKRYFDYGKDIYNIKHMSFDKKMIYNTEEKKEEIKTVDHKRIEELYEEYKKMKNKLNDEQKEENKDNDCVNNSYKKHNDNDDNNNNALNIEEKINKENNNEIEKKEEKSSKFEEENNSLKDSKN